MAMEELTRTRVPLMEDSKEDSNLDRGKDPPVDVGVRHRAPCLLQHGVHGAGTHLILAPQGQETGIRGGTEA